MSSGLVFDGLEQLKADLRNLPEDLTAAAQTIVEHTATTVAADIKAAYPVRTGNLRGHVSVTHMNAGRFGAGAIVKNTAKHAYIFELGTQARHTAIGANRGSMPAGHVFIPRTRRARRAMYERLKALIASHGMTVSGDA